MQILDLSFFLSVFLLMYLRKEHRNLVQNWASFAAVANRLNRDANCVSRGYFGDIVYSDPLYKTSYTRSRLFQYYSSSAGKALA